MDIPKDRRKDRGEEIRVFNTEEECRLKNIDCQEKIVSCSRSIGVKWDVKLEKCVGIRSNEFRANEFRFYLGGNRKPFQGF